MYVNVGKYTIHGCFELHNWFLCFTLEFLCFMWQLYDFSGLLIRNPYVNNLYLGLVPVPGFSWQIWSLFFGIPKNHPGQNGTACHPGGDEAATSEGLSPNPTYIYLESSKPWNFAWKCVKSPNRSAIARWRCFRPRSGQLGVGGLVGGGGR